MNLYIGDKIKIKKVPLGLKGALGRIGTVTKEKPNMGELSPVRPCFNISFGHRDIWSLPIKETEIEVIEKGDSIIEHDEKLESIVIKRKGDYTTAIYNDRIGVSKKGVKDSKDSRIGILFSVIRALGFSKEEEKRIYNGFYNMKIPFKIEEVSANELSNEIKRRLTKKTTVTVDKDMNIPF